MEIMNFNSKYEEDISKYLILVDQNLLKIDQENKIVSSKKTQGWQLLGCSFRHTKNLTLGFFTVGQFTVRKNISFG